MTLKIASRMLRRRAVLTVGVLTATACTMSLGTSGAQASGVELEAVMHATAHYPSARGHAEYENDAEGREFDLSLAGLRALAGHRVVVRVRGRVVARPMVGSRGRVHVDRHAGVPKMAAGNVVRVRAPGGAEASAGTLHRDRDN